MIESVVEDLAVKKELFTRLDDIVKAEAILATNTSTLPVVELADGHRAPRQVVGIHFFNPAPMMSLVEVIAPLTASEATVAAAREFAADCGKDVVEVKDRAGFIVNALLFPYLNNAVRMLEAGTASRDDIDTAMKGGCNFPMGPLALLDLVGLDTSLSILDALYDEFRDPNYAALPLLRRMVAAGQLGRKSGAGLLRLQAVSRSASRRLFVRPASASQGGMSASELFDIAGKQAVVTGGGSGIGTMIATGFVEAGVSVIIASRKEDSLKQVTEELSQKGDCSYIVADLSTEEGCRGLGRGRG